MTQSPAEKRIIDQMRTAPPETWGSREIAEHIAEQRRADAERQKARREFELDCDRE